MRSWGRVRVMVTALLCGLSAIGMIDLAPVRAGTAIPFMQSQHAQVVWQIGEFDGSAREFALAPNGANDFAKRYAGGVVFTVGQMKAADLPFIQPSAKDTLWGGRAVVPFGIDFDLADAAGTYALVIALVDTHEQFASTMEIAVNGQVVGTRPMPLGRGRAYYGEVEGHGPTFMVPVQAGRLRAGHNQVEITLRGGSWVAYDAIALVRTFTPKVQPPVAGPRRDGQMDFGPDGLEGDAALVMPVERGAYVVASDGGWARTASPVPAAGFRAEFDMRVLAGGVALGLDLPEGARDLGWRIEFSGGNGGLRIQPRETKLSRITENAGKLVKADWVHCVVHDTGSAVTFTAAQGEQVVAARLIRAPASDGRLRWQAVGGPAEFAIANLRWERLPPQPRTAAAPKRKPMEARKPMADVKFDESSGRLTIANAAFELVVDTREGLNPRMLKALPSGRLYADSDYVYRFGDGRPLMVGKPVVKPRSEGAKEVTLIGRVGDLEIEHRFTVFAKEPAIEEQVTIRNKGAAPLDTSAFACGFAKRVSESQGWFADVADSRLVAVPYKRDTETGEFCDYAFKDVLWQSGWYHDATRQPKVMTPAFGSEAWAWVDGNESLLILKYNPDAMEWSLLEPEWRGTENMALRFGGAAIWKRGDPEGATRLAPGAEFAFGVTRYELCPGDWQAAFQAFRRFMDRSGHATPKGYNPPVHWNELYDNPLWWAADTLERRAQFYRREDMEVEARKAAELGCEALYMDPGWDTSFASSIWAADRLGPQQEFARLMRDRYGLALAFHAPLAGWSDINAYPVEARRKDRDGNRLGALCSAAPAYIDTKAQRLIKLCDDGAAFLMFDGSAYTGECWDAAHGHSLPLTRQEHCAAYRELTRRVKERHPEVLIELHDPIVAGVNVRYAPTYFLHGRPRDFDELWGYEYMWDPMDDIYSGRALSLYYADLAYSIPIYLHIDLRKDNENALEFWWYASTCRHLGVGGRHPDDRVWNAQQEAMQTHRRLKRFYTQGVFYGIDETAHAHTLADEGRCVLNAFNLSDVAVEREIRFRLGDVGLKAGARITVSGAQWDMNGDEVRLSLTIPARGHRLVEMQVR